MTTAYSARRVFLVATMMMISALFPFTEVVGFVPPSTCFHHGMMTQGVGVVVAPDELMSRATTSLSSFSSSLSVSASEFLEALLPTLAGEQGGERLLEASSPSWRTAIFAAVGAPPSAAPSGVAQALQGAMSKPDNQFAILLGHAEPFVATFPSDVVDYKDDGTAWVECRLRHAKTDELLVTMGISVVQSSEGNDGWKISSLDWQDFREQFYPGLSGREWLRSF
jgi:hypothetical protein